MNRKSRAVAVTAALLAGGGILTVVPMANAAQGDSPETLMAKCNKASRIQGVAQSFNGLSNFAEAESCDLIDQNFTEFEGEPIQISRRFRNCPPDLFEGGRVSVQIEASLTQSGGRYTFTDIGADSALLGVLTNSWRSHTGTTDMTTKTITTAFSGEADLPANQIVTYKFVPRMLRMTANWHVFTPFNDGFPGGEPQPPRDDDRVAEEVVGPLLLPSGIPDGRLIVDRTEPCPQR